MINPHENNNNLITIKEASKKLNISIKIIKEQIKRGKIESANELIYKDICDEIFLQKNTYVGIKAFLKNYDNDRFDSTKKKNRDKYIDFFEENERFGINIIEPEEILFELPEKEEFYISKEDAQFLSYKSEEYFQEFGLSDEQKVENIINLSRDHPLTKKYIRKFIDNYKLKKNIYTPAFTLFVKTIFAMLDIKKITYEEILSVIEELKVQRAKKYMVDFMNYVGKYETLKYKIVDVGIIGLKEKENNAKPAYTYEELVKLAKILFSEKYDKQHNLTVKALEKSKYAEMWMYLACHFVCGWRSSDICKNWVYLNLKTENYFSICIDTLKEDILQNNIPTETYKKITQYVINKMQITYNMPQKTENGKLHIAITPDLREFFGKLILIAEHHHITTGEGYMKWYRAATYRNWVECRNFFGEDVFAITGKRNISSTRLNKSYLQGMEEVTRNNGNTTLCAHILASYARNHAKIDTTTIYLRDHGLTGESAEVVLYMMLQRGVLGVSLYTILCCAYPEAFEKLSKKEQTAIIEKIPLNAYEVEILSKIYNVSNEEGERFRKGETKEAKEILKVMFEVGRGNGKAKDKGVFCKKRAMGLCCENLFYRSCLANVCPYHILTGDGIPTLIEIIKDYEKKKLVTGKKKYGAALRKVIIPAFHDIINEIAKGMTKEEKEGIKKLIREKMYE